ncbi:MAG: hypothetical protein IPJ17_07055 [Holophagales bacterium]|nr:MAG: hypothetical protein IPJ17_07055 [Holophagales bacterium]
MYRTYSVSASGRQPLLDFMLEGLQLAGCRILRCSVANEAPFRITFETALGERMGIVAYAFLANSRLTRNRPADEHRFQVKYGSKDGKRHEIWQDPYELYTTLFLGINPERGYFVAADPVLHSPTRFFISVELKEANVEEALAQRWCSWERSKRSRAGIEDPVEVLIGGTKASFLRLVRFEQAARGLAPGHRQLLAEKVVQPAPAVAGSGTEIVLPAATRHALAEEFELSEPQILDLIGSAPRLKMAVRGWVAEEHLFRQLSRVKGVVELERLEEEGGPDISLRYRGSRRLTIECKNVLRKPGKDGEIRLDFQRTRSSKADPCSRFYSPTEFDLIAACLHSRTEEWEFRYSQPRQLDPHKSCSGRLSNSVRIDHRWIADAASALADASRAG